MNSQRESSSPSSLSFLRRRLPTWRARIHCLRDSVPLACLLCDTRTPGGLCAHCEAAVCASMDGGVRCARCDLRLPDAGLHGAAECPDCHDLSPALGRVVAAFDYEWPGDLLIQQLKLQGRYACAPILARLMAERLKAAMGDAFERVEYAEPGMGEEGTGIRGESKGVSTLATAERQPRPVITAVPSSRSSIVLRGYNPAAELGRALARRLALEWQPDLLRRSKDGSAQKGLGRDARRREVRGLYQASADAGGKVVLVVDDVMTTGSTLDAIAVALSEHGAHTVWGVVAARTGTDRQLTTKQ